MSVRSRRALLAKMYSAASEPVAVGAAGRTGKGKARGKPGPRSSSRPADSYGPMGDPSRKRSRAERLAESVAVAGVKREAGLGRVKTEAGAAAAAAGEDGPVPGDAGVAGEGEEGELEEEEDEGAYTDYQLFRAPRQPQTERHILKFNVNRSFSLQRLKPPVTVSYAEEDAGFVEDAIADGGLGSTYGLKERMEARRQFFENRRKKKRPTLHLAGAGGQRLVGQERVGVGGRTKYYFMVQTENGFQVMPADGFFEVSKFRRVKTVTAEEAERMMAEKVTPLSIQRLLRSKHSTEEASRAANSAAVGLDVKPDSDDETAAFRGGSLEDGGDDKGFDWKKVTKARDKQVMMQQQGQDDDDVDVDNLFDDEFEVMSSGDELAALGEDRRTFQVGEDPDAGVEDIDEEMRADRPSSEEEESEEEDDDDDDVDSDYDPDEDMSFPMGRGAPDAAAASAEVAKQAPDRPPVKQEPGAVAAPAAAPPPAADKGKKASPNKPAAGAAAAARGEAPATAAGQKRKAGADKQGKPGRDNKKRRVHGTVRPEWAKALREAIIKYLGRKDMTIKALSNKLKPVYKGLDGYTAQDKDTVLSHIAAFVKKMTVTKKSASGEKFLSLLPEYKK